MHSTLLSATKFASRYACSAFAFSWLHQQRPWQNPKLISMSLLHGIRQMRTGWADGPEFVTQCPIRPGGSYTYRFTIQGQEGTLWWHAHSSWLRATVYGALIIHPKQGDSYPFTKPKRETTLLLGEWWNANPINVLRQSTRTGGAPNVSDAYTINGQPGDLYNCSSKDTVIVPIDSSETNLLRVINAALNQPLFFSVANHKLTVVSADASYTKPFTTTVLMLGPGQTTDVLITGDQPPARHGIRQMRTGWADGPEFVTQCPIRPGGSYTYRFTIQGQEGTLWWHAHSSWLRATVYGALIIHPKQGDSYPFTKPKRETTLLLGEWWNANPINVLRQSTRTGGAPNVSDAYTINGQPGDLYNCSSKDTVIVPIDSSETNLLRVINAALNQPLFFSVANHKLTVVSADASYTKPFTTTVLMLGPGQTTDVLITGDQPPARYYLAARAYFSAQNAAFDNTTTTAILEYKSAPCSPNCKKGDGCSLWLKEFVREPR
ncbi:hypothetical protein C1H46_040200 [Malus baccata]|uniref:laccase n=1 Tax=Malus baccata TaxID=106549 RepID=A0A540KJ79_MALBA|nr:hypothetical protein C1H46_040200 [Malus baccata]